MANLTITKSYTDGTALTKSLLDTSFDDVSTWLNARDNASASWLNVKITGSSSSDVNLLSVNGSGATTSVIINNTATDGDPKIDFQLSGSSIHSITVDDSDSDYLKFATTGGVGMQMLGGATARVEFKDGNAVTPSRSFISDVQTGPYRSGSNEYAISIFGTGQLKITDGSMEPITDNDVTLGTASKKWSDVRSYLINGADYGFANGYILREWPCTLEDVYNKSDEWMRANANQGIQIINDNKEIVAIIKRDGTIQAKKFELVTEF